MLYVMTSLSLGVVVLARVAFLYALMLKMVKLLHEHRTIDMQQHSYIGIQCSLKSTTNVDIIKPDYCKPHSKVSSTTVLIANLQAVK